MKLINLCLYLYVLLKPFYLGGSGYLQISDIFILIAFILCVCFKSKQKNDGIYQKKILKNLKYFIFFLLSVMLINLIYYQIYGTKDFIMSTVYFLFIFIGILAFTFRLDDKKFLKNLYYCFVIDLIMQVVFYYIGIGKMYGGVRYMGTFNDPNQFGFFVIMAMSYIYTISNILKIKSKSQFLIYIIIIYLIYLSASTGMILALATFFIIWLFVNFKDWIRNIRKSIKYLVICVTVIIMFLIIGTLIYSKGGNFKFFIDDFWNEKIMNSSIMNRFNGKIDKISDDSNNFFSDRNLDKMINNPVYVFWGAGQGNFQRFGNGNGEIHSTFPSILFCYGILPFLILSYWIYINLKGLNLKQLLPYIAIFIESFTLLNQRQLLFWVIIILANAYIIEKKKGNRDEKVFFNNNTYI